MKDIALMKLDRKQAAAKAAEREGVVHPYNGLVSTMLREGTAILEGHLRANPKAPSVVGVLAARESGLPAEVITAIAARSVVDGISSGPRLQSLAERIGSRVEDEVRMRLLKDREPPLRLDDRAIQRAGVRGLPPQASGHDGRHPAGQQ